MNGAAPIAKNAAILTATQLLTWMLALPLAVLVPRYLGPESLGSLSIASAIWAIPNVFIAFGTDALLVKEIARAPERAADLSGTALALRLGLYAVSWVFVAIYLALGQQPALVVSLAVVVGIAQVILILAGVGQAAIQGLELIAYSAIAEIAAKAVLLVLIIGVLLLDFGVFGLAYASVASALVFLVVQQTLLLRRVRIRLHIDRAAIIGMVQSGRPFLLSALAMAAYTQVDSLIIAALVDQRSVGYYSVAQRVTGSLLFIPTIFITTVFPVLARTYTHDPVAHVKVVRKSFDMLLLVAIPIGLGTIVIAKQLVMLVFGGQYAASGPIVAVQGVTLILLFLTILLGRLFAAADRQRVWTRIMLVAVALTVPLDLVLVPWCQQQFGNGALGGVLSFIVTESGMVIAGITLLPKGSLGMQNVWMAARLLVAGLVMFGVTWQFRAMFIVIPVSVGAATYTACILGLRVLSSEDLAMLKTLARRLIERLQRRIPLARLRKNAA